METSILSSFILTGHGFDPESISRRIGLEPMKTWKEGDRIQNSQLRRKHSGWVWSSCREETLDLGKQVGALLEQLRPYLSHINSVREEFRLEAEISCAVYIGKQAPAVYFDRSTVNLANELQAEIDIDLYVCPESD